MLSIIIPTLNEEDYLPLLLESISRAAAKGEKEDLSSLPENQDFKINFEIIIADAGSTDKTIEIAQSYGCKITKGGLPGKGRNEGAKLARGDLLLFLDADLILPRGFLRNLLKKFKDKNLDIASTDLEFISKKKIYKIAAKLCNFYYNLTQHFLPHITECILVKKYLHEKIGGFNERVIILEDFDYVRRIAKVGKFGHLTSIKFYTSTRRFEKEGLIRTLLKYILADIHLILLGPVKSDILDYKFGHYSKNQKKR